MKEKTTKIGYVRAPRFVSSFRFRPRTEWIPRIRRELLLIYIKEIAYSRRVRAPSREFFHFDSTFQYRDSCLFRDSRHYRVHRHRGRDTCELFVKFGATVHAYIHTYIHRYIHTYTRTRTHT